MKKAWKIFTTDIKNVATNWVAAVIITGLIILPSLYAWFNIAAMWDPYSNTGNLPVAVVNEDQGGKIRDEKIDVGKELVKQLKKNDSLEWHFTDRATAMDKVENGDYFAVVIIPKDFSKRLSTVISEKPKKGKIEYYVNEKINSISPKITEKGASTIVDQVSSEFVSTVNGVIFDIFNKIGIELQEDLPDIDQFENYVFLLEKNLPEINRVLNQSLSDANSAQTMLNQAQGKIPEVRKLTSNGLTTVNNTMGYLTKAEDRLNSIAPRVQTDLETAQQVSKDVNEFLKEAQNVDVDLSQGNDIHENVTKQLKDASQSVNDIQATLTQLKKLQEQYPETGEGTEAAKQIDEALKSLEPIKQDLQNAQVNANEINQFVGQAKGDFKKTLAEVQKRAETSSKKLDAFATEYKNSIEPTVIKEVSRAKETLTGAKGILTDVQSTLPEVERVVKNTQGNLKEGTDALNYAHDQFPYVNEKVRNLADKIRKVEGETDINEIIELLRHDPEAEQSFFEEPVQLKEHSLFPIENYGTGMTPFYTVLSIWVGALLLISLLSVEVNHQEEFTGRQVYFGRYFIFWLISFLQTIIVTAGDLLILGVSAKAPFMMLVFGVFISLIFILIVYTFVSLFGNVGKAMAIVLLVLQIAGSGGTYPVVLLPKFFQSISPFLPFTYAVDLMREAVGGIVWERVAMDMLYLSIFGLIALLLGTFLKVWVNERIHKLMKKSKESGLLH